MIELIESTSPRQIFIVSEFASGGDLYKYMNEVLWGLFFVCRLYELMQRYCDSKMFSVKLTYYGLHVSGALGTGPFSIWMRPF